MSGTRDEMLAEIGGRMMRSRQSALLVIDVQAGSFHKDKAIYNQDALLENIRSLISKARAVEVPIFFTKHNGPSGTILQPETPGRGLHPAILTLEQDIILDKNHPDAFQQTGFQQELETREIKTIVIAGIQTEICVDTSCRRTFSEGYDVILVSDGHSTYDTAALTAQQIINYHNFILGQWFVKRKTTAEIDFAFEQ